MALELKKKSLFSFGTIGLSELYDVLIKKDLSQFISGMQSQLTLNNDKPIKLLLNIENLNLTEFNQFLKNPNSFVVEKKEVSQQILKPSFDKYMNTILLEINPSKSFSQNIYFLTSIENKDVKISFEQFDNLISSLGKDILLYDYTNLQGWQFKEANEENIIPPADLNLFGILGEHNYGLKLIEEKNLFPLRMRRKFNIFINSNRKMLSVLATKEGKEVLFVIVSFVANQQFKKYRRYSAFQEIDYIRLIFPESTDDTMLEYYQKPATKFLNSIYVPYLQNKIKQINNYTLKREEVHQLSDSELEQLYIDQSYFFRNSFPKRNTFEKNGNLYGFKLNLSQTEQIAISLPKNFTLTDAYKIFVNELDISLQTMKTIFSNVNNQFTITLTNQKNFDCGWMSTNLNCGKMYLENLLNKLNTAEFNYVSLSIQSQFFHEQIHIYTNSGEQLGLLGEFLYAPKENKYGNEVFRHLAQKMNKEEDPRRSYNSAWRNDAIILIWEYKQIVREFEIPKTIQEQLDLVFKLPELFSKFSKTQRYNILKKYVKANPDEKLDLDENIKNLANEYSKLLGLKF